MNNQYHQAPNKRQTLPQGSTASNQGNAQVQFYQPHPQNSELGSQKISQSYGASVSANQQNSRSNYPSQGANLNPGIDMMARETGGGRKTSKTRSGIRPSSATVAGQAGRFLSNQQSKRKYAGQTAGGQSGQSQMTNSQLDQISYSYQQPPSHQPQPMMNNLLHQGSNKALNAQFPPMLTNMNNQNLPPMGMQVGPNQFGSHRNSNQMLSVQPQPQKPPFAGGRKKPRP